MRRSRTWVLLAVLAAVAGCGLPRGAAIRTEITRDIAADPDDYAFYTVRRALLPALEAWPVIATEGNDGWPRAGGSPTGRVIRSGDMVTLTVWDSSDNSLLTGFEQRTTSLGEMVVSPSGRIFVPYVGEVRISGMSPDRARASIQYALSAVAPDVQVQLALAQGTGSSVNVVAGVAQPGVYPLVDGDSTVLTVLSQAGGVGPALRNPRVKLGRGSKLYAISLDRLYQNPEANARIQPGDRIIVEEDDRYFLSLGAAGREALVPFPHDRLTALEAVSLIGGIADTRADPEGLLILRQYPREALASGVRGPQRERVVFSIDMTTADGLFSAKEMEVMPGDVVLATESPVSSIQVALSLFGGGLGFARQLSN